MAPAGRKDVHDHLECRVEGVATKPVSSEDGPCRRFSPDGEGHVVSKRSPDRADARSGLRLFKGLRTGAGAVEKTPSAQRHRSSDMALDNSHRIGYITPSLLIRDAFARVLPTGGASAVPAGGRYSRPRAAPDTARPADLDRPARSSLDWDRGRCGRHPMTPSLLLEGGVFSSSVKGPRKRGRS